MEISSVIQFEGPVDALVWKSPIENFNATSQLIVDETHEALLVINGNAADLFTAGSRTLTTANIPIARSILELPTDGRTPFPCKVFFVNMVHQMDMRWGTQGPITLNDPLYDIFLHVMSNGSLSFTVKNTRKFLLKLVGFRDSWNPEELVSKFRGIISAHVKDCISKIMINGMLSYFVVNASVFELSGVIKERLDSVFDEYGIELQFFNIDTIEVPESDYQKVKESKERAKGRQIEGYTWQDERRMAIAEKFAGNEGSFGAVGGAIGGIVAGGAVGSTVADIARNALSTGGAPANAVGAAQGAFNVSSFFGGGASAPAANGGASAASSGKGDKKIKCAKCGAELNADAKFCNECGEKVVAPDAGKITCPNCGASVSKGKFCPECGARLAAVCPKCGRQVGSSDKFCPECGEKL